MGDDQGEWDPGRYVYVQLAELIEADVAAGRLPIGARLGSHRELAEQYGVAQMTVRRAVALLAERGIVSVLPGRGTYVISTGTEDGNDRD